MSVTVAKNKGVTVVTIAANGDSTCPALWEIFKALCYSPACCSVSPEMLHACVPAALGTLQIMVGLFNIGLGPGRTSTHPDDLANLGAAYWLGGVVGFTAFMNIVGTIFAITGIVLYAIDLSEDSLTWMCRSWNYYSDYGYGYGYDGYYRRYETDTSAEKAMQLKMKQHYEDNCDRVVFFAQRLLMSMDITLIILAVLQLCVSVSVAALCIKALIRRVGSSGEGGQDVERYKPLLKDITITA
uniref:Uncharacterized LOC115373872 n=1 Tax=Myripristis murdjan TaxID=586833 RepID=A0A667WVJ2_9TELE